MIGLALLGDSHNSLKFQGLDASHSFGKGFRVDVLQNRGGSQGCRKAKTLMPKTRPVYFHR
jgi:hypothetical protein